MKPTGLVVAFLFVTIAATLLASCSHPNVIRPHYRYDKLGADFQNQGIMSQKDYLRLVQLSMDANTSHLISNGDLDWAIALMHSPSTNPPIVHAKVIALFEELQPIPADQRVKILAAVRPLLGSQSQLDRVYAQAMMKKLQ